MKNLWVLLGLLLFTGCASAVTVEDACSSRGYAYTDSLWVYDGGFILEYGTVDVNGTARKLNWSSTDYIDGVVYKSGNRTYLVDGGYNGTIPRTTLSNDFVFVAFCRNQSVPEFGLLGGVVALLGVVGVYLYRRKS